jgi:hypothetical protein
MDLQRRVERLERQNRLMKLIILPLVVFGLAAILMGASDQKGDKADQKPADVVRAKKFEVIGDGGKVFGVLSTEGKSSSLELRDGNGNTYLKAFGYDDKDGGGTLYLHAPQGLFLNIARNGEDGIALTLFGKGGPRASMTVSNSQGARFYLNDQKGGRKFEVIAP